MGAGEAPARNSGQPRHHPGGQHGAVEGDPGPVVQRQPALRCVKPSRLPAQAPVRAERVNVWEVELVRRVLPRQD